MGYVAPMNWPSPQERQAASSTMGAGPSIEKAFRAMDDEELTTIVQQAYQVDPSRMERILAVAKLRHMQSLPGTESAAGASLQTTASASITGVGGTFVDLASLASSHQDVKADGSNLMAAGGAPLDGSASGVGSDRMAALWTFSGHTLRELRGGNTSKKRSAPTTTDASEEAGSPVGGVVDDDGYPVLYGSCGRDKKYARCSVCYFRGARCNTAHYCACCQRPVCIRPRTYPGEEHPKICWNVLHMDKDMIQRVDKRRARKIHQTPLVVDKPGDSEAEGAMFEAVEEAKTSDGSNGSTDEDTVARAAKLARLEADSGISTSVVVACPPTKDAHIARAEPEVVPSREPSTVHDELPSQQSAELEPAPIQAAQPSIALDDRPQAAPSPEVVL